MAERLWLAVAVLLLAAGLGAVGLNWLLDRWRTGPVTGEIMPELARVDRIEAESGDLRGFNVLIITTDTTRADHIGCYGNKGIRTPVIDGLAREGILCATTATPSPSTLPAHSSLMTGLYPFHHGVRANGTFRLEDDVRTLAERMQEMGYRTAAAISAFVLDGRFGLDQGFETYFDDLTKGMKYSPHMFRERAGELTNEPVLDWLDEHGREKFFLWVHYFDPHAPYLPPEPFRSQYARHLYDGEIAYADSQIGLLLGKLEALGVRDQTLVVYASDHGEGLGEHGEQSHSLLIYDATLHVPLIFNALAHLPHGKVIHRQTSLVDVVPTVLWLLGEPVPHGLDGVNLCAAPEAGPRSVYIETIASMTLHGWAPLVGVRRGDFKYILAPTPELYDLKNDPRELTNIHDERADLARTLHDKLVEIVGGDPLEVARAGAKVPMDEETRRKLEALGYVFTAGPSEDTPRITRLDPKEMVHHWEKLQHGIQLSTQGKMSEALPIIKECVAEVDGDIFARSVLASCYVQRGDYDEAMKVYRRSVELEPNDESLWLGIASVHAMRGELEEAQVAIQRALEIEPESAQARLQLGRIALRRQDEAEALRLFEEAIKLDPGTTGPEAYNEIGYVHLRARRLDEARDAFRAAIRIDTLNGSAHDGLANVLIEEGNSDAAVRELAIALRFDPNQPRALATLASILGEKGEEQKAIELCQRALEISPKFPHAHNNLGLIYRRMGKLDLAEEQYRKAIEYGPFLDAPYINLAQLFVKQGKVDEAMGEFEKALRVNPYCTIALANLGARHFNEGRVDLAYQFYQRALQINPDYALVHKNIASIYALRDDPERAAQHLQRSLELDPRQPEAEQMRYALSLLEEAATTRPSHAETTTHEADTAGAWSGGSEP